MKDRIRASLNKKIDARLTDDLVESYEQVKDAHIRGNNEIALSKAGKFVENVFRVLKFLKSNQILKEVKLHQFNDISEELLKADGKMFPESIRILIPRIAVSMIYEPRSKLGAVHVKEINPDFIDGKLVVGACDWIMAEFLRLYHTRDAEKVEELIQQVVKDYIPVIMKIREEIFIDAQVECREEILIRLSDAVNGLARTELGTAMKHHFSPTAITLALQKLSDERGVFLTSDGKYIISDSARKTVAKRIVELSRRMVPF